MKDEESVSYHNNVSLLVDLRSGFETDRGRVVPHSDDIDRAVEIIEKFYNINVPQPGVFPFADGSGIQLEWDVHDWYIELCIENNQYSYMVLNNRDEFKSKNEQVDCTEASITSITNLIKMLIIGIKRMKEIDEYNERNKISETDD